MAEQSGELGAPRDGEQAPYVDIVFDGPPSHDAGRFVEVENEHGQSVRFGQWVERADGLWALRIVTPSTAWSPAEPLLHRLTGGSVVVRTYEADPDNGWDASVVVCASLDSRAYATPEVARAIAADLLAAADVVEAPTAGSNAEPHSGRGSER